MTLSTTLTLVNICGGSTAAYCLLLTMHHYQIGRFMAVYVFILFATMAMLVFNQFYIIIFDIESTWLLKLLALFLWCKSLYFAWAIRFSSLKK